MLFFGIDPSLTGTGLSVIDEDGFHDTIMYGTKNKIRVNKKDIEIIIEERLIKIKDRMMEFLASHNISSNDDVIYIEDLAYSKHSASATKLAGLHYFLRVHLYETDFQFKIIKPTTLKKFVLGKKNKKGTKKQQMLLHIYKRWSQEFNNDNMADAFALAQYARYEHGFGDDK